MNIKDDEYSGLMTPRERQWIVNIQLNQLKCENPFLDDYYYTVFHQKKDILEASEKYNTEDNNREGNERKNNLNKEDAQIPRYNIILELIRELRSVRQSFSEILLNSHLPISILAG